MICYIIVGAPCSGKSTIVKQVIEASGIRCVSSGDIARKLAEIDEETKINLSNGLMATEDKMREAMINEISGDELVILDGFPRFQEQYEWLLSRLADDTIIVVFNIVVSPGKLFSRMLKRNRSDDNDEAFKNRVEYFKTNTANMILNMKDDNRASVFDIDNNGESLKVGSKTILKILELVNRRHLKC